MIKENLFIFIYRDRLSLKVSGLFTSNIYPIATRLIHRNHEVKQMISERIKNKIKFSLSEIHNSYVGKERDRLDRIREELEEQRQVKKILKKIYEKFIKIIY